MRVVATGVFDIIHSGHAHFLNAAKENGDELVVIIANDDTVRKMKGEPILSAEMRAEVVSHLKPVSSTVIGRTGNMLDIIVEEIKPDVIALGYDQEHAEDHLRNSLKERGFDGVRVTRVEGLYDDLDGTRKIIAKILQRGSKEGV